jgi:hypothetical protein
VPIVLKLKYFLPKDKMERLAVLTAEVNEEFYFLGYNTV